MTEPRISIGLPVYNGQELLAEALDSILSQRFEDFEVVISDNASTDSTPEICRAYEQRDKRIRYARTDVQIPIPKNFSRAFRLSRGQYFKWHAHDDLLEPDFLVRCVEVLDVDPTTIVAGTGCGLIEKDGSRVPFDARAGMFVTSYGERIPAPRPPGSDSLASPRTVERFRSLLFDIHGPDEGKYIFGLIRSDALSATPLNQGYIGGDKVLLGRLSLAGRFTEIPDELFLRRYLPGHVGAVGGGTWSGRVRLAKSFAPDRQIILFPLARQIGGYFQAIYDAEISSAEKARCAAVVVEKVVDVGLGRAKRWARSIREELESR